MDAEQIKGLIMLLGFAEQVLGSDVIPGLKKFLGLEYQLTPEQLADLDAGFLELSAAREKLQARRAEISAAG